MKLLEKLENGKALDYAHDVLKKDKEFIKLIFSDLEIKTLEDIELVEGILENIDEDLLGEKDLALYILEKLQNVVEILVNSIEKDDDEALDDILDVYEDFFEELDDELRADREVVLKMASICDDFKKFITKENGFSEDVVEECVDFIEDCFEEVDESLFGDDEFLEELEKVCPILSELELNKEEDDDDKCHCECGCKCEEENKECTCQEEGCHCEECHCDSKEETSIQEEVVEENI